MAADMLAQNDFTSAREVYAGVLNADPERTEAMAGMMRSLIGLGETKQAQDMLAALAPEIAKDKAFEPVRAALELAEQAATMGPLSDLQAKVQKDPKDMQARYDLAMAYFAAGQREQAVDELLECIRRDRKWNEEAARKQLVKLFEAFGHTDELTVSARRRLSSLLFL
jgi:putative thioredoxin